MSRYVAGILIDLRVPPFLAASPPFHRKFNIFRRQLFLQFGVDFEPRQES
jgi:hypothetical protein